MKERVTVNMDTDLIEKMKKDARREQRPLSNFINKILRDLYKEKRKEKGD